MIRQVTKEDKEQLKPLLEQLGGHTLSLDEVENRLLFIEHSPFDSLYVYAEDHSSKDIIGLLAYRLRENIEEVSRFAEIAAIVVDERARKMGIGKQLVEFAEQLAKEQNCIGTWLVSGFGREEQAHVFYKANGYEVTGYRFVKRF